MGNIKDGTAGIYKTKIFLLMVFMLFIINMSGCSKQFNKENVDIPTSGEKQNIHNDTNDIELIDEQYMKGQLESNDEQSFLGFGKLKRY